MFVSHFTCTKIDMNRTQLSTTNFEHHKQKQYIICEIYLFSSFQENHGTIVIKLAISNDNLIPHC
jgi:hypothetical protein